MSSHMISGNVKMPNDLGTPFGLAANTSILDENGVGVDPVPAMLYLMHIIPLAIEADWLNEGDGAPSGVTDPLGTIDVAS